MDIENAVKKFPTPFYLYDKEAICRNFETLKNILPFGAQLYYSVKANPLYGICKLLVAQGSGLEIASAGELYIALKSGCPADKIIFTSPGKTKYEIQYAVENNIHIINAESYSELELINCIAEDNNKIVNIAVRVNPSALNSKSAIRMSGVTSQFGIEENEIDEKLFEKIRKLKNVVLKGIQVYMGTQNLDADSIASNTDYALDLACRLSQQYDFSLEYVNCGGGFGVPYFKNDKQLDLDKLKIALIDVYKKYEKQLANTEIVFESGRFIMADTGVFVTKILYDKISKGTRFFVCDGGSNFHASSAFLGRFVRNNFPLHTTGESEEVIKATITGPLCTPTDVIGQNVEVAADTIAGDYVIIEKSGAYGLTDSPYRFLGHEAPSEILDTGKDYLILRERETKEDVLYKQNMSL